MLSYKLGNLEPVVTMVTPPNRRRHSLGTLTRLWRAAKTREKYARALIKLNYNNSIHSMLRNLSPSRTKHPADSRIDSSCGVTMLQRTKQTTERCSVYFLVKSSKKCRLIVASVGGSWQIMSFMTSLRRSSSGESVLFLARKTNDSKYSLGIPKRSH